MSRTWNHRVVRRTYHHADGTTSTSFMVHEVYYDEDDLPSSCTEDGVEPYGETLEELVVDLVRFRNAAELPVLDYDEVGR